MDLNEILKRFPNGEMRYRYEAVFRKSIDCLLHNVHEYEVMEGLFKIITEQQNAISELSRNLSPPAIVVDKDGEGIGHLYNFVEEIVDVASNGVKISFEQKFYDPDQLRIELSRHSNVAGFIKIESNIRIPELDSLKPGEADRNVLNEIKSLRDKLFFKP